MDDRRADELPQTSRPMRSGQAIRIASVIGLPLENRAEYERYHAAVWPEVLARLTANNVHNYSIYRHGDLLFSYYEYTGEDLVSRL